MATVGSGSSGSDPAAPPLRSAPTCIPRGSDGGTQQPEKKRRGKDILPPTPEQWYQQNDDHMRSAVLVGFSRGQPFNEASDWFYATSANFEIK